MTLIRTAGTAIRSAVLVGASLLTACTGLFGNHSIQGDPAARGESTGICGESYPMATGLELAVVEEYFEKQQYRSALAHLEELDLEYVDARIMQADALRAIGELEASNRMYLQLVSSCLTARAYRGLALNAFEALDRQLSLRYMTQARHARPTDAGIRNDLGYLLLLDGRHGESEQEFLTALELDRWHQAAAQNLALLYLHQGESARAERIAETYRIRPAAFDALKGRVGLLAGGDGL